MFRPNLVLLLAVAVGAGGAEAARSEAAVRPGSGEETPRVTAVELSSAGPGAFRPPRNAIEIEQGSVLTREAIRETLLNLHADGGFGRAEIWTQPEPDGVRVLVVVHPKLRVTEIRLLGELCIRRSTLENRLQQIEGVALNESRIIRGVYRLQETLEAEGYRDAQVRVDVAVDEERGEAVVSYDVQCEDPTRVESIALEGDLGSFSFEDLSRQLRLQEGERIRKILLEAEAQRLQSWLITSGHKTARVGTPVERPATQNSVTLAYTVSVGPLFEVSIAGADERLLRRKGLLELLDAQRFDEALLLQVVSGIRRFYQERGHHAVEVAWELVGSGEAKTIRISVREGPTDDIGAVVFSGNKIVGAGDLAARMTTGPRSVFGASGRLVSEVLEDDLANLEAYYARRGFPAARVGPAETRLQDGELLVKIPVEEGPQDRLVALEFFGIEDESVRLALGALAMRVGGPFHRLLVEEMLDGIRAKYEEAGYLWAQVEAEEDSEDGSRLRSVAVRVLEGPQVEAGRIVLRGNARTRSSVILRGLGIEGGDTISRRVLLDAQRRLYRLGIFSSADVRLAPGVPFSRERDVLVRVEEGRSQRLSFGLGYDSEDGVRSLLGYWHADVGGRAVSARLDLRVSEREEQFRALLRQPFVGRRRVPVTYSLFAVEEEQESFDSRRRGAQIEAHRQKEGARFGLLYTYKIVEVLENPEVPLFRFGIDRNLREVEVSSLTPSLVFDRRDDPLVPTRGWTLNVQSEFAFPLLSADADFVKLFGQHTTHLPLGRRGVIAGSLRFGGIEPRGGSESMASSEVPISEQFFAGGRTTHRAYRRDLLGVLGSTLLLCNPESGICGGEIPAGGDLGAYRLVPVGGNGLFLFNLDYRFPLAGPVGGTVFVDGGNVWSEWSDLDPGEVKLGAGVGVRYLSPIGPLRLEIGWKFDREVGESGSVVSLSFGNPF